MVFEFKADELHGDEFAECCVVKRDPHDTNLLALGIEDKVYIMDTRKKSKTAD